MFAVFFIKNCNILYEILDETANFFFHDVYNPCMLYFVCNNKGEIERKSPMINRLNSTNVMTQTRANAQMHAASPIKKDVSATSFKGTNLQGANYAKAYQAMNNIKMASTVNFGSLNGVLTDYENSIIGSKEIKIDNILDMPENVNIKRTEMPEGTQHLNSAGLNVETKEVDGKKIVEVTNDAKNKIFVGKFDDAEMLPKISYRQGKFMPEITVSDDSLNGKTIKMLAGSKLKGNGFEMVMPGKFEAVPGKGTKPISFSGRVDITTLNKEPRTRVAVDKYKGSDLTSSVTKGDFYDEMKANDPTIIIPAGGFGERFYNIAGEAENKPSAKMPTDDSYRIIGTTLNLAASAGILNGDETDEIRYLSQLGDIEGDDVSKVSKYKTDGGAIAEGLVRDIIPNGKDAVILNADIFTNADITRTYRALKELPNAALVIPYYPVNPERAKAFGLLGIEQDENGNKQIKEFLEKPKYTAEPPKGTDFVNAEDYDAAMEQFDKVQTAKDPNSDGVFLANPGFYFLSPEACKVLMAKGILNPSKTGLGAHVMPEIVKLANEGKLLDKDGNQMKAYTVPLEAKGGKTAVWDDIGTAEAYLKLIKDVGNEYRTYGNTPENKYYGANEVVMRDFSNNADPITGIVFDSEEAKEALVSFNDKYDVEEVKGNIFIAE